MKWFSILTVSFLLISCNRPRTYHYDLIVDVETPEGPRTGSSTIEVTSRLEPRPLPDMRGRSSDVRGEAVVVGLPGGQALFATLMDENGGIAGESAAIQSLVPRHVMSRDHHDLAMDILSVPGGEAEVPREFWPLLVRFRDRNDPRTVEVVDPANLEAYFGPGVRLRRIRVRTRQAYGPSLGLQGQLPWLTSGFRIGVTTNKGARITLDASAFQRRPERPRE